MPEATDSPSSSVAPLSAGGGSSRVLIVDDDPFMVRLLTLMMQRLGPFEIHGQSDPHAALALLYQRQTPFDAVVLDINMPGIDGMELFRHLGRIGFRGCVVLFSGESPEVLASAAQLARSHGLNVLGSLGKPPDMQQLQQLAWACAHNPHSDTEPDLGWQPDERQLREAIERGDIGCMYQPKVDVRTGRVVGAEALARWHHDTHGIVSPSCFVPLAEACGAIAQLTRAVLETALAQQAAWSAQGLDLSMSVNASAHDLGDLDFAEFVTACAQRHGVQPANVVIEVTESSLGGDPRLLVEVMSRLRLRRFALALDDFGNGYSTLSKLRDVVFDEIKIDRGFTHAAHASARSAVLFDASTWLGRRLDMRVVAEGVEDLDDWRFCRAHGVDAVQGYFISAALPAAQLPAWAELWRQRVREQGLVDAGACGAHASRAP